MKKLIYNIALMLAVLLFFTSSAYSQDTTSAKNKIKKPVETTKKENKLKSQNFVDKNGDGYNDNAPDDDGDGIPNGLDPDYINKSKLKEGQKLPYIDLNGDGINDYLQNRGKLKNLKNKPGAPKDIKPQDGTGQQGSGKGNNNEAKKKGKK